MTAVLSLPHAIQSLRQALVARPTTALACLAAWLDPLPVLNLTPDPASGDTDELLLFGLDVCRTCFPEVYAQAVQQVRHGSPYRDIERVICHGMRPYLEVAPDSLDSLSQGVPFQPMGITYGPEFEAQYPDLVPILTWLGADPDEGLEDVRHVMDCLITSLSTVAEDETAQDILWLLHWLYGSSGNTAVDYSEDAFWESGIQYEDWTPDHVAFMNGLHREAGDILDRALRGATTLRTDTAWQRAFRRNAQILKGPPHDRRSPRLRWPARAGRRAEQTPDASA